MSEQSSPSDSPHLSEHLLRQQESEYWETGTEASDSSTKAGTQSLNSQTHIGSAIGASLPNWSIEVAPGFSSDTWPSPSVKAAGVEMIATGEGKHTLVDPDTLEAGGNDDGANDSNHSEVFDDGGFADNHYKHKQQDSYLDWEQLGEEPQGGGSTPVQILLMPDENGPPSPGVSNEELDTNSSLEPSCGHGQAATKSPIHTLHPGKKSFEHPSPSPSNQPSQQCRSGNSPSLTMLSVSGTSSELMDTPELISTLIFLMSYPLIIPGASLVTTFAFISRGFSSGSFFLCRSHRSLRSGTRRDRAHENVQYWINDQQDEEQSHYPHYSEHRFRPDRPGGGLDGIHKRGLGDDETTDMADEVEEVARRKELDGLKRQLSRVGVQGKPVKGAGFSPDGLIA